MRASVRIRGSKLLGPGRSALTHQGPLWAVSRATNEEPDGHPRPANQRSDIVLRPSWSAAGPRHSMSRFLGYPTVNPSPLGCLGVAAWPPSSGPNRKSTRRARRMRFRQYFEAITTNASVELRDHVKEVVIPGRLAAVECGYVSGQNGSCSEDQVLLWGIIL